jgi:CDP-glucose 4,6-dehydratase
MITQAYGHSYHMPAAVTRFGNLYGGGDLNWNRIVPGTMRSVIFGQSPIVRSDGTPLRDYLFVEDAVSGYMMLAEKVYLEELHGLPINFGMDQPISALEMVKSIIEISDQPDLEPIILNNANNEITDQYLASNLANEKLGWYPKHQLKDGLLKTYTWYKDFLEENP